MTVVAPLAPQARTAPLASYPVDARHIPTCPVCRTDCTDTLGHALAVFDQSAARRQERSEVADFLIWPDDPRWQAPAPTMAVAA